MSRNGGESDEVDMVEDAVQKKLDRFLREAEVHRITGLSRTTRWRLEREGQFPKRRQLSANATGWLQSEISGWVASKAA